MNKRVDLCTVCDLNETLVRETARDFGIPDVCTSTGEMFSSEGRGRG